MATVPYVIRDYSDYRVYEYDMVNGDVGQPIQEAARYSDKGLQVYGIWGSGGNLKIEGSNDASKTVDNAGDATYDILRSSVETDLNITSSGFETIMDLSHWLRPRISAGDATTKLKVWILIKLPQ